MKRKIYLYLALFLTVALAVPATMVYALSLSSLSDTMSTLKENTAANHDIRFVTPVGGGVAAGETITINFPSFTIGSVDYTDIDFKYSNDSTCTTFANDLTVGATASGATWGAAFAGTVLTIESGSGTIAANRCIQVLIGTNASGGDAQLTSPAAGLYSLVIAGTFGDTGNIGVRIIGNDQVAISATVNQSLTFSVSTTTIGFGALDVANDRFATNDNVGADNETEAHNIQASTNGSTGYSISVKGATLTYSGNTITAIGGSNTASQTGVEQFGLRFNVTSGTGLVSAPYAAAGFAYAADATTTDEVAATTTPSSNTTYSARYVANIAALTEAGSYTTALTYVATANY